MQTNELNTFELVCNISLGLITVNSADFLQLEYKHYWKMAKYYHFYFLCSNFDPELPVVQFWIAQALLWAFLGAHQAY